MPKRRSPEPDDSDREAGPSDTTKRKRMSSPTCCVFDIDLEEDVEIDFNEEPTQEELEDLEKRYLPQVEAQRLRNQGRVGTVASAGIIEKIELCQFMCHKYLTFEFGAQLNFIVGHNGSGKSAVLAGIAVGLGGKAAVTGRGAGVKSLIREGQNKAEITITIKNTGDDAYRHEVFGDKIIVIRTISRNGSSTYKLKSAAGKLVSNHKTDLDAMCECLEIHVDNPISILTQDAAKTFLKGSSPEHKYKLFMQGTYLERLRDEYELAKGHTHTISKFLETKKDYVHTLRERFDVARKAYKESLEAQDIRSRMTRLQAEKAWALVSEKEAELEEAFNNSASSESRLEQINRELANTNNLYEDESNKIKEMEERHNRAKDAAKDVWSRRDEVKKLLTEKKKEMQGFKTDQREIEQSLNETQTELSQLEIQVIEESQNLEEDVQARKETTRIEIEAMRTNIENLKMRRVTIQSDLARHKEEQARAETQHSESKTALEDRKKENDDLVVAYNSFRSQMQDPLLQYGKKMREVLAAINSAAAQWRGKKPLGPLGSFVVLKDQEYQEVMRQHIGHVLCAFAVSDPKDIRPLRAILKRTQNFDTRIIVTSADLFNYSHGEPPPEYLTALRILEISNPVVERILIDSTGVERLYVAPTRKMAADILTERGEGVALAALGFKLTQWKNNGGNKSEALRNISAKDNRYNLFRYQNNSVNHLQEMTEKGQKLVQLIETLKLSENQSHEELQQIRARCAECEVSAKHVDLEIRKEEQTLMLKLEEDQADSPVKLAVLENLKQEKSSELELFEEQIQHVKQKQTDLQPEIMAIQRTVDALKKEAEDLDEKRQEIVTLIEEEAVKRARAISGKQHYETKKAQEQATLDNLKTVVDAITLQFEELRTQATALGESEVTTRSAKDVEQDLAKLNNTLTRYESRLTKPIAETERELEVAKKALADYCKMWFDLAQLYEVLSQAIARRREKWAQFRAYRTIECKNEFMKRLSSRGYFGQVVFDHIEQRLELKIQTDDQAYKESDNSQRVVVERKKDPASLSGGEKSLTTLCFLLSLWEVCGVSIRCLDEFDVYMDNQNRRYSIKMLIEAAKSAVGRQTIIVTPQSIDNVFSEPPTVLIKQMADPRR